MFNRVRLSSTGTLMALVGALLAVSLGFLAACDSPSLAGVDETPAQAEFTAENPDPEGSLNLQNRTPFRVGILGGELSLGRKGV